MSGGENVFSLSLFVLRYTTSRRSLRGVSEQYRKAGNSLVPFRLMLIWERGGWFLRTRGVFLIFGLIIFVVRISRTYNNLERKQKHHC